ncbi:MAG TPA: hypothetical protein VGE25_06830 [Sediminibacterium sp.]
MLRGELDSLNKTSSLFFVCDSRDYHAMDWFHQVKEIAGHFPVSVATDISSNVGDANSLLHYDDNVVVLFNIEKFLFSKQSTLCDIWRNIVKLFFTPMQIRRLRKIGKSTSGVVFHAHSMYYIFLCWLAGVNFIATPMGSDVLVRPFESRIYMYMTKRALRAANIITADSIRMQDVIKDLVDREAQVIQNGINVREISKYVTSNAVRNEIASIRGFYDNYQIHKIMDARAYVSEKAPVTFIYPFYDENYRESIRKRMMKGDEDLGRLDKEGLYNLLARSFLIISIPESDSSPRSVYEAIFCGCAVVVSYSPWVDSLPECMKKRVIVADLEDNHWLQKSIDKAREIVSTPYVASMKALMEYDQYETMKAVCKNVYKII